MMIYILRDGIQSGPFSEEETQHLLKQGGARLTDLAWQAGMPEWIQLQYVLYPPPAGEATPPPPPPPPTQPQPPVAPTAPSAPVAPAPTAPPPATPPTERASAKQNAFLIYMGVSTPPNLSKEQAALLVNDTMENPKDPARLVKWNDERLRLHPDLFAAEISAKKDNRANVFYDRSQTDGAECFKGVGKAHCQVLIGYLDNKFPNWDAREKDAIWNYFFPALAEKFPDLVTKEWKGKLNYSSGPKVAPELAREAVKVRAAVPTARRPQVGSASPMLALMKGLGFGIVALIALGGGILLARKQAVNKPAATAATPTPAALPPASAPVTSSPTTPSQTDPNSLFGGPVHAPASVPAPAPALAPPSAAVAPVQPVASEPAMDSPAEVEAEPATETPAPARATRATPRPAATPRPIANGGSLFGTPAKQSGNLPASQKRATSSLFGPASGAVPMDNATPDAEAEGSSGTEPALEIPPPLAAPARKMTATLTQPTEVKIGKYGSATLTPGMTFKVLGKEGANLKVMYQGSVVLIPASVTDFTEAQ